MNQKLKFWRQTDESRFALILNVHDFFSARSLLRYSVPMFIYNYWTPLIFYCPCTFQWLPGLTVDDGYEYRKQWWQFNIILSKCGRSWEKSGFPLISSPPSTVSLWESVRGLDLSRDLVFWMWIWGWFGSLGPDSVDSVAHLGGGGEDGGEFTKSTQSKSGKINPEIQSAPEKSSQLSNPHPHKDFQLNFRP